MKKIVVSLAVASVLLTLLASTPAYAASTIVVPRDYPTIQAAVDAAAPGDTIMVESGTYTEEVVIGKDVNLRGAGVGATVIKSPATLIPFAVNLRNGRSLTAIVRVGHGAHVRISGLTVSGPIPCGLVLGVVAVQSANLELTDARVSDILPAAASCPAPPAGRSVSFGVPLIIEQDGVRGSTASGRVTGVVIDGFQSNGLVVTGPFGLPPSSVTFAENVVTAGVPQIPTVQSDIDVSLNAVVQVTGNTISGGVCTIPGCGPDPINEFQAMGVLVDSGGVATITDNHISGSDIGIYQLQSPNCCKISENTLTDNRYFGIVIQDGGGTTFENTISGGEVGIGVVAGLADTVGTLHADNIENMSVALVQEIECCGFTATAIIKDD